MVFKDWRAYTLALMASLGFGLTLPLTKWALLQLPPLSIASGRAVLAGLTAALFLLVARVSLPNRSQWGRLLLVACGVVFGFPLLTTWAMQYVPAAHAGVVIGTLPLATALFADIYARSRGEATQTKRFWLLALVGALIVSGYMIWHQLQHQSHHQPVSGNLSLVTLADIALIGSVFMGGMGYAVGGRLSQTMPGHHVICWALVISLPVMIGLTVWSLPDWIAVNIHAGHWQQLWSQTNLSTLFSFAYVSWISMLLGFFAWNKALALGGITRMSQVELIRPFITLLASYALLGEVIHPTMWLAATGVIVVIALIRKS